LGKIHREIFMKLIVNGDSWTFGSEIVDPQVEKKYASKFQYTTQYDYFPENDQYRIPRNWAYYLGQIMNAEEVINLSVPADDNGTILNRTITYITEKYIFFNKPVDDLLVIIGWSSPERNFFWYKDGTTTYRFRIWPYVPHFQIAHNEQFWEYYISYLWNEEEYIPRYVMNNIMLQNFCEANHIKWMAFNSFYQTSRNIFQWRDMNIKKQAHDLKLDSYGYSYSDLSNNVSSRQHGIYNYGLLWETINPIKFYKRDHHLNTFKNFIDRCDHEPIYNGMHPSTESHKKWAEELYRYMKEHSIL
jgi:hypothetical protein